ncbi:hypothetical protein DSAG12_01873 [Promethearchaeum syntrophicum]|uniref:Uncharacterized protein n=1 Tax=Promethearchaeum syntrophicum TaxID=2594042 RepID=A0A5B9DAP8_9ARCH|nr:hypothetical protein [Candidatus Prometheoarchaeum syntrophicum]
MKHYQIKRIMMQFIIIFTTHTTHFNPFLNMNVTYKKFKAFIASEKILDGHYKPSLTGRSV